MAKTDTQAHNWHTKTVVLLAGREGNPRDAEEVLAAYQSGNLRFFIEWAEECAKADSDSPKKERLQLSLSATRENLGEGNALGAAFHAFFAGHLVGLTGEGAETMEAALSADESRKQNREKTIAGRHDDWQRYLDALRKNNPGAKKGETYARVAVHFKKHVRTIERETVWRDAP